LPSNPVISPGSFAPQGLTNFNLGRSSAGAGVGGFVFSAASDSVNLLIRALKTQGRLDALQRPQVTAYHNQPASIQVGQQVPIVTGVNITPTTGVTNIVEQTQVGIILSVTPRISPDGYVIMQIQPQVSSLSNSTVNLGNGAVGTIIDLIAASTIVMAMDGQTAVIGGLITRRDERTERKVRWFGDLPYVGAAFRFRTQVKQKRELIILLTPRVVRNAFEARQVMSEEARKMDWFLGDVEAIHDPLGIEWPEPDAGQGDDVPWMQRHFLPEQPKSVVDPKAEPLPLPREGPTEPLRSPRAPSPMNPAAASPLSAPPADNTKKLSDQPNFGKDAGS